MAAEKDLQVMKVYPEHIPKLLFSITVRISGFNHYDGQWIILGVVNPFCTIHPRAKADLFGSFCLDPISHASINPLFWVGEGVWIVVRKIPPVLPCFSNASAVLSVLLLTLLDVLRILRISTERRKEPIGVMGVDRDSLCLHVPTEPKIMCNVLKSVLRKLEEV